jgi:hypothetical protein
MNNVERADAGVPVEALAAKAATQARLQALKKGVTAAAVVGFGVFSWLAIPRGTTASSPTPAVSTGGDAQQNTQPQSGPFGQGDQSQGGFSGQGDQSQGGGFFGQGSQSQGGFFGQGGGGYGFGNGQGGPVSGSGVS